MQLALVAPRISGHQRRYRRGSALPLGQRSQARRPVERIDQGLGGQGTDTALRVQAQRAHREKLAGHCQAKVPGAVTRNN